MLLVSLTLSDSPSNFETLVFQTMASFESSLPHLLARCTLVKATVVSTMILLFTIWPSSMPSKPRLFPAL